MERRQLKWENTLQFPGEKCRWQIGTQDSLLFSFVPWSSWRVFIHGLFGIRPWSSRQTALLPQGLVPCGPKVFPPLSQRALEKTDTVPWCWMLTLAGSQIIISHDHGVSCHGPASPLLAGSSHQVQELPAPSPLCNIPDFVLLWRFWAAAVGHLQLKPPCPATLDLTPSVSGLLCHLSHTSLSQFYHLHFPKSGCCLCELLWVLRHCWLNREVPSCPHHPTSHCWWPPIPRVPHPWGTLWIFYPGDDMEYPLYNPPEPPNATCCVLGTGSFKEKGSESQMLQTHSRQTPEECWTHTIRNLFG